MLLLPVLLRIRCSMARLRLVEVEVVSIIRDKKYKIFRKKILNTGVPGGACSHVEMSGKKLSLG